MPEDLRVKYTKNILKEALLKLLSEKPIHQITVTHLCKIAGINRSTFYFHYTEMYDLFEQIENEFIEKIHLSNSPFVLPQTRSDQIKLLEDICQVYLDNKELFIILYGPNGDPMFVNKIVKRIIETTFRMHKHQFTYKRKHEQELAVYYVLKGCLSTIYQWLTQYPDISKHDMAVFLTRLNYEGILSKELNI
ncbi:TetR/AcrR family transcriptional regulator [Paenibacillus dakarensis]|uniref:TetR/AcrR family transcriptional regulator n=1 Tax=Paenibacillus dakarensis TaxID=1527293 RepID=UPI0006D54DA7|nr:TetR/AcrR family transcriptional regulator [Paenibacillus dakarensis]